MRLSSARAPRSGGQVAQLCAGSGGAAVGGRGGGGVPVCMGPAAPEVRRASERAPAACVRARLERMHRQHTDDRLPWINDAGPAACSLVSRSFSSECAHPTPGGPQSSSKAASSASSSVRSTASCSEKDGLLSAAASAAPISASASGKRSWCTRRSSASSSSAYKSKKPGLPGGVSGKPSPPARAFGRPRGASARALPTAAGRTAT
mmetsp:Transcript_8754/g.24148  ORF Transcript_8754/g.24148 Transcript_8754/m.24148 type:complete len:206 (-) Transcript_8754:83-700(-)